MGSDFNYAEEFKKLDVGALKQDIIKLMTTSRSGGRPTTATMVRSVSG
jgi:catalase (peroxidase I)